MPTVFSHIIQKRFSQVNEDVASDALTYILNSSESALNGMMKLLRSIEAEIPDLRFQAQQTEDDIRPDIWGFDQNEPRVYIENKFWAGLTENQPISYLKKLSEYKQPTILLVIGPEAREQTLRRELIHRLAEGGISISKTDDFENYKAAYFRTDAGPTLALTTWPKLLSILKLKWPMILCPIMIFFNYDLYVNQQILTLFYHYLHLRRPTKESPHLFYS